MTKNFLQGLLWSAIFVSGCAKIHQEVSDRDYAIQLLNERRYEESIFILRDLVAEDPGDDSLKVLLATAYGGNAGFNLIDSFSMFEPLLSPTESLERKLVKRRNENPDGSASKGQGHAVERSLLQLVDQLQLGFSVFFGKANMGMEQRSYLVEGLATLTRVSEDSDVYVKAKSYSSVLNLVQFINYTRDAFPSLEGGQQLGFSSLLCAFEPAAFFTGVKDSSRYLSHGIEDYLIVANLTGRKSPDPLMSMQERITELDNLYDDYRDSTTDVELLLKGFKNSLCP